MRDRAQLGQSRRWVVKVGSSLVTQSGWGLDHEQIAAWVDDICYLRDRDCRVVLISSGAVAQGVSRLGWPTRPEALNDLHVAAAVGQMGLIQAYESCFQKQGVQTAQVLFTHDDMSDRRRYLNMRSTLNRLLDLGVIPVVNENDTVATKEHGFGDNDRLAALTANLVEADVLAILTDQQGMYDSDPVQNPQAKLLDQVSVDDTNLDKMASGSGLFGRGGMVTKVQAARLAARSGTTSMVLSGRGQGALRRLVAGEHIGTVFCPAHEPLVARKQWLAGQMVIAGSLHLDDGAVKVLQKSGKSLLSVGVKKVVGRFQRGAVVACIDEGGHEVARGLINYSSVEVEKIKGKASSEIKHLLGYVDEPELIHRDNLVLMSFGKNND